MLVASLDLVCLHRHGVDSVDHIHEVIVVLLIGQDVEVAGEFVTVEVAFNSDKLPLLMRIRCLDQVRCVVLALLSELLIHFVPLSGCHYLALVIGTFALRCRHGVAACRLLQLFFRCTSIDHCFGHGAGLCLLLNQLRTLLLNLSKEIHVIGLIHEVCLVAFDDRHVLDGFLVLSRWPVDHALVKQSVFAHFMLLLGRFRLLEPRLCPKT